MNYDASTLEVGPFQKDLSFIPAKYGYPWYLSHRVDLHNELKLLATSKDGYGAPVEIRTKSSVTSVVSILSQPTHILPLRLSITDLLLKDPEKGVVILEDSTSLSADLIVAADGVHSNSVAVVIGQPNPAMPTGHSAFRFLIPSEAILEDPETCDFLKDEGAMKIFIGTGKRIVWYPCRL